MSGDTRKGLGEVFSGLFSAGMEANAIGAGAIGFAGGVGFVVAGVTLLHGIVDLLHGSNKSATVGIDLGSNKSDSISQLPLIFGTTRVGFQKVAIQTSPTDPYLWLAGALGQGPAAAIGAVYFDDVMVIDANGRSLGAAGVNNPLNYLECTARWVAYGTQDQLGPCPNFRGDIAVTAAVLTDHYHLKITTGAAHGFLQGDCIEGEGLLTPQPSPQIGYVVSSVQSPTQFTIFFPVLGGIPTGGGTVDFHYPGFMFGMGTLAGAGRGIPWMLLRLTYDQQRFPNGVPRITVDVTGGGGYDLRTATPVAITGSAVVAALDTNCLNLTVPSHSMSEGVLVQLDGTGSALDGVQRVDRVVDSNTLQFHVSTVGLPSITTGTATKLVATTNPIIALRSVLLSKFYGVGASASEVDDTAITAAANFCDNQVTVPVPDTGTFHNSVVIVSTTHGASTSVNAVNNQFQVGWKVLITGTGNGQLDNIQHTVTSITDADNFVISTFTSSNVSAGWAQALTQQNRFTLAGVCDGNGTVKNTIEHILAACRGTLVWQGGKYSPTIRDVASPEMTLDKDVIVGGWKFVMPGQREKVNVVRATFMNSANFYQLDQAEWPPPPAIPTAYRLVPPTPIANQFLIDDQGQLNRADIDLTLVGNLPQAQQIAMVRRNESRNAVQVEVTCHESVLQCTVGDLVSITHETPGWVNQGAWIVALIPAANGLVQVGLELYAASAYSLDNLTDTPFKALTTLPNPLIIADPTSFTAAAFTDRLAFALAWIGSATANAYKYELQYRVNGTTTWYDLTPADGAATSSIALGAFVSGVYYDFQIRARTLAGGVSNWVQALNTLLPFQALANFKWTDSSDGLSRTYSMVAGLGINRVLVFSNTLAVPPLTDPWPADGATTAVPPLIPDPTTGIVTYTVLKPSINNQTFIQFEPRFVDWTSGPAHRAVLDANPAALSATLKDAVNNATVDLSANVQAGLADWPVLVEFLPDDPLGAVLCSITLSVNTTVDKTSTGLSALGGLALPLRASRRFWIRLTNVAGAVWLSDPISVDRVAIGEAAVTVLDYRAAPTLKCDYLGTTTSVVFRLPGGKTKTFSGLSGSGQVSYTVGDGSLDGGAAVENALVYEEVRVGYQVDVIGGGVTTPVYGGGLTGTLHGQIASAIAQGGVYIDSTGQPSWAVDGPLVVDHYHYAESTSAFPSDGTAAAGTNIAGRQVTRTGGALLTRGQTLYVTIVPYDVNNVQLPSIRLSGSYQTNAIAQATVSVATDGSWTWSEDGPANQDHVKYAESTSAFPSDVTAAAGTTLSTPTARQVTRSGGTALTRGQEVFVTIIPYDVAGNALPSIRARGGYQVSAIAQGTVSVDSNGAWSWSIDGPANQDHVKYAESTSAFPSDATAAAGTALSSPTGRQPTRTGGTALTFGQTIYVTVIPYDAAGNALPSVRLRGSYQTYTGSKTTTYGPFIWVLDPISTVPSFTYGANFWIRNSVSPVGFYFSNFKMWAVVPSGTLITNFSLDVTDTATPGTAAGVSLAVYRLDGNTITALGTATSTVGGGPQTLSVAMTETSSTTRTYLVTTEFDLGAAAQSTPANKMQFGNLYVTSTPPTPNINV